MNEDPDDRPAARVLHIDDGRTWRGGQHQVWLLLRELAGRGVAQRLAAREGSPLWVRAVELGISVEPLRYGGEFDVLAGRRLAQVGQAFRANILHAHTGHAHALALAAARAIEPRPCVLSTRRVDFPLRGNWFSRRKYRDPRQHYIAISEGVRRVLVAGGVAPERIDVVHSGVPALEPERLLPRAEARAELGIGPDEIAIGNVGALTDHKGQRWLIEAATRVIKALPPARVHLLGEGELREALERQVAAAGLEGKVVLHGWVEDARHKLAAFDLFVSSSHLEGLGTTIIDAMLTGVPVVATAAGGVPEVVIDGRTGLLVPAKDASALAAGILAALGDSSGAKARAATAREHVEKNFSARAMGEGNLKVYSKILVRR